MPYKDSDWRKSDVVFKTVPVRCPRCGWRLLDAVSPAIAEVQQLHLMVGAADSWRPDFFIKCRKCGAHIAFRTFPTTEYFNICTEHDAQAPPTGRQLNMTDEPDK